MKCRSELALRCAARDMDSVFPFNRLLVRPAVGVKNRRRMQGLAVGFTPHDQACTSRQKSILSCEKGGNTLQRVILASEHTSHERVGFASRLGSWLYASDFP